MRSIMEDAVRVAGLHVTEGGRLWDVYIDFERERITHANAQEEKARAIDVTRSLYHRRLRIPLMDADDALKSYIAWEKEQSHQDPSQVQEANLDGDDVVVSQAVQRDFELAQRAFQLRWPFEETLINLAQEGMTPENMQHVLMTYLSYIDLEESGGSGDVNRVKCIYERAVSALPLTAHIWLKYGRFLEKHEPVSHHAAELVELLYHRAVRNCPWSGELWSRLMRALERHGVDQSQQEIIYTEALNSPLQHGEDVVQITLARATSLRRRGNDSASKLRSVFSDARNLIGSRFPEYSDAKLRLTSYWAKWEESVSATVQRDDRHETHVFRNDAVAAARKVWESALATQEAQQPLAWSRFAAFEISHGNLEAARQVYQRCLARRLDTTIHATVCEAWLEFEREYGSEEEYHRACVRTEPILEKAAAESAALYQQQYEQQQSSARDRAMSKRKDRSAAEGKDVALETEKRGTRGREKRPRTSAPRRVQDAAAAAAEAVVLPKAKKSKVAAASAIGGDRRRDKQNGTKATENVSDDAGQFPEVRNDHTMRIEVDVENGRADTSTRERTAEMEQEEVGAPRKEREVCVKHLPHDADDTKVRELFKSCGDIKRVKLAKDRMTGSFRGSAYIEFTTADGAKNARATFHGKELGGKKLSVFFLKHQEQDNSEHISAGGNMGREHVPTSNRGEKPSQMGKRDSMKPRLDFVPRAALARHTVPSKASHPSNQSDADKSNADFRKLLQ